MISFKQFLQENYTPLYHATSLVKAEQICDNDCLLPLTFQDRINKRGISLTRDIRFATNYNSIVFEFDKQQLQHKYKIVPFQWFGSGLEGARHINWKGNEFEEFLITRTPLPLSKYIKRIVIGRTYSITQDAFENSSSLLILRTYIKKHNIPIIFNK